MHTSKKTRVGDQIAKKLAIACRKLVSFQYNYNGTRAQIYRFCTYAFGPGSYCWCLFLLGHATNRQTTRNLANLSVYVMAMFF